MKQLRLYNALTDSCDTFIPSDDHDVKIYCCGPTVHDTPHLGHARTYIFLDVLRRVLRDYLGYGVRTVMNITDLDSKIIEKGGVRNARKNETLFFETMKKLNVTRPDFTPRVTDFVDKMSELCEKLILYGYAYKSNEGKDIYFNAKKFSEEFKRVFPQKEQQVEAFQQNNQNKDASQEKLDPRDFVLWEGSQTWVDCEGNEHTGMPGWHTQCAAMLSFHFSHSIDIHVGGIDLQCPHHENEIAIRSARCDNNDWVQFCLYTGHLQVDGEKMSKSLENFTTLEQVLVEGYSPLAIRYMFLKHPYGKPMSFRKSELDDAQESYTEFMQHIQNLKQLVLELEIKNNKQEYEYKWPDGYYHEYRCGELMQFKHDIDRHLMNNMNIPQALELLECFVENFLSDLAIDYPYEWVLYSFKYILWMTDTCFGLLEDSTDNKKIEKDYNLFFILKDFRSAVQDFALHAETQEDIQKFLINHTEKQEDTQGFLLNLCDKVRKKTNKIGYYLKEFIKELVNH